MYESLDEVMKPADVAPTLYVCKSWLVLQMPQYFWWTQPSCDTQTILKQTWKFGFTRVFIAIVSVPDPKPTPAWINFSIAGGEGRVW